MLIQRAFAKINLGLRVLRKRPDDFHEIETIFYRVDISDQLFVSPARDLTFECDDPTLSSTDNLVYSAASLLRKKLGVSGGARMVLKKRIPVGAGLGGGSADAATALLLLSALWGKNLTRGEMEELALRLGSDVPYFLHAGSAHATSRGERLSYFPLEFPYPIVVCTPDLQISTRDAYGAVVPNPHEGSDDLKTLLEQHLGLPELLGGVLKNDFQSSLFNRYPLLRDVRREFLESGAGFCSVSGSGSSLFAVYPEEQPARAAMEGMKGRGRLFYTPPGFRPDLTIEERPVD
jgi:4-diphosphocytidyl-2-C-methyl-D-erythritol kinase